MRMLLALLSVSATVLLAGDPVAATRQVHGESDYSITFTAEAGVPITIIDFGLANASGNVGTIPALPVGFKAMDRIQSHWVECPAGWSARFHSGEGGGYFISLVTTDQKVALSKAGGPKTFRIHNIPYVKEIANSEFSCVIDPTTFNTFQGKIK